MQWHYLIVKKICLIIKLVSLKYYSIFSKSFQLKAQISELKEVVSAASRLNEQLERKDETISYLQQQSKNFINQQVVLLTFIIISSNKREFSFDA